ncbi:hypothetical protein PRIPAC_72663, partial [Pristionchus pacificus]
EMCSKSLRVVWVLLVLCQFVQSYPFTVKELDLPPYLRGIQWYNVQEELMKDFRLDPTVLPIFYDIHLDISVKGYNGANRSTFDGYVSITLNVSEPKDTIELHSVNLTITKAELIIDSSIFEISKFEKNRTRETVIFTLPQALKSNGTAILKVHYNGTAVMRESGLFEYWTRPENKTITGFPTISLVSDCEPAGARRWFPCFDEPDKKSHFRLVVTHPKSLTAYSNTAGETKRILNGMYNETTFHPTVPLPTYLVALAITEQPAVMEQYKGQMIGAIGRNRKQILPELKYSMDYVRGSAAFENVTFFPEKTAWLLVEDGMNGAMENPGLITSGPHARSPTIQIHELAHMYFGNLVTLRSWEQIWINEGFASLYENGGKTEATAADVLGSVSAHEAAMHETFTYTRSQYLNGHFVSNAHVHYEKASQLLRLIKRFIGAANFDRALNRYLIENSFGNGDSEMMIDYLSADMPEAREILKDWVYQPGVALLTVKEEQEKVTITQRRFLRTDFMNELRDNKTRWTIPLYYKINDVDHMKIMPREDKKFVIHTPANCNFSIDESFPYLYAVHYVDRKLNDSLSKIIYGAAPIVLLKDQYFGNDTVSQNETAELEERRRIENLRQNFIFCNHDNLGNMSRSELFNMYLLQDEANYLLCDSTLKKTENAKKFLFDLWLSKEGLDIRIADLDKVQQYIIDMHPGIVRELKRWHAFDDTVDSLSWPSILQAASKDLHGMWMIRSIVRMNPRFSASLYHTITRIFENEFVEAEKAKRKHASIIMCNPKCVHVPHPGLGE